MIDWHLILQVILGTLPVGAAIMRYLIRIEHRLTKVETICRIYLPGNPARLKTQIADTSMPPPPEIEHPGGK